MNLLVMAAPEYVEDENGFFIPKKKQIIKKSAAKT